jgi:hypothetical protein
MVSCIENAYLKENVWEISSQLHPTVSEYGDGYKTNINFNYNITNSLLTTRKAIPYQLWTYDTAEIHYAVGRAAMKKLFRFFLTIGFNLCTRRSCLDRGLLVNKAVQSSVCHPQRLCSYLYHVLSLDTIWLATETYGHGFSTQSICRSCCLCCNLNLRSLTWITEI